ncbi:hypothetical protein NL676_008095 [Syzygium grande]|nr:hypothetical protein NL676_008095 [Syzygium grande]
MAGIGQINKDVNDMQLLIVHLTDVFQKAVNEKLQKLEDILKEVKGKLKYFVLVQMPPELTGGYGAQAEDQPPSEQHRGEHSSPGEQTALGNAGGKSDAAISDVVKQNQAVRK